MRPGGHLPIEPGTRLNCSIPDSRFPISFPAMKSATFETNRGTIVAELYENDAPKTVENFETLAN